MKSKKLKVIVLFETPPFKAQNDRYAKRGGHNPLAPRYAYIYISKILSAFNQIDTFLAF